MKILKCFSSPVLLLVLFVVAGPSAFSQVRNRINSNNAATQSQTQYDQNGRAIPQTAARSGNDSLKHRDNTDDSITIYFRYFDSTRIRRLDSSIRDLNDRFPTPASYVNLGNLGTAAHSLIFRPNLKVGTDAGFHSYDIYRFNIEETKFYQTTRPFTQLGYLLGSKSEQMVNILHTQNIRPDFNVAFEYRFLNSPGTFQNQNTSHNNYRINGSFQSTNKRYTSYLILLKNKLRASEHGGVRNEAELNKSGLNDPFDVATRMGGAGSFGRNFFNTTVNTGNLYDETSFLYRHQYDLGQKDSLIVNDSTTIRLFYPRIRFQHTFKYSKSSYQFQDNGVYEGKDSAYNLFFGIPLAANVDSLYYVDRWKEILNDFSIISFPEKNNPNQFLKLGAALQNLQGIYKNQTKSYFNAILNAEYRNRTRNQKWDLEANGQFYAAGNNLGDYAAQVSLKRTISAKIGSLEVGFQNVNRTPSFIYSGETSFPVRTLSSLNKENTTRIFGRIENPANGFTVFAEYFLVSNYTYFDSFFTARQEGTLFNLLHIGAEKKFRIGRNLNLYSEIHLQQTAGNPPIHVPLIFTRHRLVYEANLFKNLFLATGIEFRYHTPYKADNYSPFVGQFFYQDNHTISNRPDVNAFFNFRIKRFRAFIRAENLNTLNNDSESGFGFTKYNFSAPHYPTPSFWFRLGIWWNFIN